MNNFNWRKYIPFLIHALAWILLSFLLLLYVPLTWKVVLPKEFWIRQVVVLIVLLLVFYVNAWIIVPHTLIKNRRLTFAICTISIIFVIQLAAYIHSSITNLDEELAKVFGLKTFEQSVIDDFVLLLTLLVIGISTSYTMLQSWQETARRHEQLEQQQIIAELSQLKAQINPHFFFNTLNSIYSLTYINVEDSRKALHTLSHMMRYVLYGTQNETTSLSKEVDFIKDYLTLMRMRLGEKLKLNVQFPEPLQDYTMAPMLLLPYIENAFKHGISATEKSEISICLSQQKNELQFEVKNRVFNDRSTTMEDGGIGLANTQRRLELIYPNQHQLTTGQDEAGKYKVVLQLQLALQ
jgi:two-component system, LytTR family, sensor kinase